MPQKNDSVWNAVARYMGLAMTLPAATFTGYVIGYGLDRLFGTSFLKIVLLLLGIAAGFIQLVRELGRDRS